MNKMVGDNQGKKREESCWTEYPRSLTPSAGLTLSAEGLGGHRLVPSSTLWCCLLRVLPMIQNAGIRGILYLECSRFQ